MRREERVSVQGPVKKQQPDGMSHRGGGPPLYPSLSHPKELGGGGSSTSLAYLEDWIKGISSRSRRQPLSVPLPGDATLISAHRRPPPFCLLLTRRCLCSFTGYRRASVLCYVPLMRA